MSSFKLVTETNAENPNLHDIELLNGQVVFVGMNVNDETDQRAMLRQRVDTKIRLFKGEWYLNQNEGMPWHQKILTKGVTIGYIKRVFRRALFSIPGVAFVEIDSVSIDKTERTGSISFTVRSDKGIAVSVDDFAIPFVVKGGITSND
jgi:hypothetical protein